MTLSAGTRLGPYEIVEPIGKGGMGEVYEARDTRLERTVAIKVLPEHLAHYPERKARFEREAKAISQLNHPNICTLHDVGEEDGVSFLVMERIEGETLADRLARGRLKNDEAGRFGVQIADALDKAHRAAVVHRDLKPANIMLTVSGVKLLDFGLAKLVQNEAGSEASDAPTQQRELTREQAIIGTLQYMAPEQLEGKKADARTDIWALGAVLYEMVTGRKAFPDESQAGLIAGILEREPKPLDGPLEHLVMKSLAKDPEDRWQTARDVATELEWRNSNGDEQRTASPQASFRLGWAAAAVVLGVLAAWGWMRGSAERPAPLVSRLTITLPDGQRLVDRRNSPIALSPDGRRLVYAAESDGDTQLYLRELDSFDSVPIVGTEGGRSPFFSPDGEWVAFFTDSELKKVTPNGSGLMTIAPADALSLGGSWGTDGTIVYTPSSGAAGFLARIRETGGTPERLLERNFYTGQNQAQHPQFLPDGKTLIFSRTGNNQPSIWKLSLDSGETTMLDIENEGDGTYLPTGHVLYTSGVDTLEAVAVSTSLAPMGPPTTIVHGVVTTGGSNATSGAFITVAENGTLAYVTGTPREGFLVYVDHEGKPETLTKAEPHAPRWSPDGRYIAYNDTDVHVFDLRRETLTRLDGSDTAGLVTWSADSRLLIRGSNASGLKRFLADGSSDAELVLERELSVVAESRSPDGHILVFNENHPDTGLDIWTLQDGQEPEPFLATAANENGARFSPDQNYLAYQSDESGTREIYVRPFPSGDARWKISPNGGSAPVWSPNGEHLYYRSGQSMMVVDVTTGDDFTAGRARKLFDGDYLVDNTGHPGYDIDPTGERFIMVQHRRERPLTEIRIVFNWFEELERLVPTH